MPFVFPGDCVPEKSPPVPPTASLRVPPEFAGVPLTLKVPCNRTAPEKGPPITVYMKFPVNPCSVKLSLFPQPTTEQVPVEVEVAVRLKLDRTGPTKGVPPTKKVKKSWPVAEMVTVPPMFSMLNWLALVVGVATAKFTGAANIVETEATVSRLKSIFGIIFVFFGHLPIRWSGAFRILLRRFHSGHFTRYSQSDG
jgi:hypothetical protein